MDRADFSALFLYFLPLWFVAIGGLRWCCRISTAMWWR